MILSLLALRRDEDAKKKRRISRAECRSSHFLLSHTTNTEEESAVRSARSHSDRLSVFKMFQ